ncbi:hypothetical protein HPB47_011075 [Ixodes persulcatus]|uniref:Uncharacterized protein n=1 Tax=Ixodes persulcatus TaxID=34615 RepID=A0AC60NY35_IXOPE|nr:hypothetical protein HPB47_011075 [Ixodes persulcatus]
MVAGPPADPTVVYAAKSSSPPHRRRPRADSRSMQSPRGRRLVAGETCAHRRIEISPAAADCCCRGAREHNRRNESPVDWITTEKRDNKRGTRLWTAFVTIRSIRT